MLMYKLQTSKKPARPRNYLFWARSSKIWFITVHLTCIHCNMALCNPFLAFVKGRMFIYVSVQSFLLLLLLPRLVSISACFRQIYRCEEIMFLGVSGKQTALWRDPVLGAFCSWACSRSSWDDLKKNSYRKPHIQEELPVSHWKDV